MLFCNRILAFIMIIVALITPPAPLIPNDSSSANRREQANMAQMDDLAARDALLSYVSQFHCWGLTAAKEMTILDIVASSAFQVFLAQPKISGWRSRPPQFKHSIIRIPHYPYYVILSSTTDKYVLFLKV